VRAANLLGDLSARGHEYTVVAAHLGLDLPDVDRFGDIPVHRFHFWEALQPGKLELFAEVRREIVALKRSFQPDLVHADLLGPSLLFHLLTRNAHRSAFLLTVQQHGSLTVGGGTDSVLYRALEAADWVTFCSKFMRDETLRLVPDIPARNTLIPNAIKVPEASVAAPSFAPPRLVCVGRMDRRKGFDIALKAFSRLIDRYSGIRLALVGDGPVLAELKSFAVELGVAGSVDFAGWVSPENVPALMSEASVVVVPSRLEAFGLTALEAAFLARPVVAFAVGGLTEVVEDGRTGYLVPPDSDMRLAEAIARMLDDPAAATKMGAEARSLAIRQFSWQRHVDSYDDLYARLCGEKADVTVR
jgi:glycosyltransferase involved in cell wall biosynthesis